MARTSKQTDDIADSSRADSRPVCGVIMPISATVSHTEDHWRDVQSLLHRGISAAGFRPENVWDSTSTDRVSERIIGNIFSVPLVVADISELNPNVMLELGLRLASKKPTIVVVNTGGTIPFDIRDFHAIFYPSDMNMLGMEEFFRKLSKVLKEKHFAYESESYTPFLGNVIVDVASPETRELGLSDLLLSRFDDIADRIARLEIASRPPRRLPVRATIPAVTPRVNGSLTFDIPEDSFENFSNELLELYEFDEAEETSSKNGIMSGTIKFSEAESFAIAHSKAEDVIKKYGGEIDIPF